MNLPALVTARDNVVLRELDPRDAAAYFEAVDASRQHLSQFGDTTSANYPTLESVTLSIVDPKNPSKIRMGIWDDDTFVGTANLTPNSDGDAAELGYWVDSRYENRGYATLAARALAGYGFERFGRVYAHVATQTTDDGSEHINLRSVRVLQKAGFEQTAKEQGRLVFELYAIDTQSESDAEKVSNCPIHQWAADTGILVAPDTRVYGITEFLDVVAAQTGMPDSLRTPLSELLLIRGEYDPSITATDAKTFATRARELTLRYELTPPEAYWLKDVLFLPLIAQWVSSTESTN